MFLTQSHHRWAFVTAFYLLGLTSPATAGGFLFDPRHCPHPDDLASPNVPSPAIRIACSFLELIDLGELKGAYLFISPETRAHFSMADFVRQQSEIRKQIRLPSGGDEWMRYLLSLQRVDETSVMQSAYRFELSVVSDTITFREDIVVAVDRQLGGVVYYGIRPE